MKDIQLYDYQREMIRRIDEAFRSCQSVMVQMPTGTGKTILLAEVVKSEKLKGKNPDGEKSEKLKGKNPDGEKSEKLKGITRSKLDFD